MAHPPRLTLAGLFLGFLLFVAPSEANQCSTGCHGIQTTKAYQEGRTYTYQLDGDSLTSITDARGEAALKLNAVVELSVKPDCMHQIRLKNVKINGAPASQEIERHALQFNYHNGHIDTEVCAEPGDTQASLNIKRAVISLFQDAVVQDDGSTTHPETDVFGGCPTDFVFSSNGESRTIKKFRNLEQCSYRENLKQDLISSTFNLNSNVKSTPLLAAELKVEQQFNRGILSKASSVETYKYKPFSNGDAGLNTVVQTTLTFKGESGGSNPAPVSEPKSLIFEAPHQVVKSSVEAITRAIQTAKESMPDAVTLFSARRFAELIKVLRQSSERDILTVFARVKAGAGFEKESARKVFLDALFRTGTGESAGALVTLLKSRELGPFESIIYYSSLVFVRHASLSSVTAVASLLDQPNLPRIGYLGIGSLIGKYCQEHKCENVPEVNAALAKISSKLIKANTREQEDGVISALKALGNARYLDDATLVKIAGIAADVSVHNRVRIAALEALPTRCSMKWKEVILRTLADLNEDSEIRIKAYLSLVACPCPHVANKLKETIDKETINQVGSFITSHLRNLRASTNPDKLEAQRQLGLIKPRTKFPEDFRKFSYNNELSYSIDAFGIGSSAESNVIFSQNSFVPRSASLNLTTEIFGHSFNFLEIDGRAENLDKLIESYFGPKGVLRASNRKNVVLEGRKNVDELFQQIKTRFEQKRRTRSVNPREIDNFMKQVHLPETELNDDLELDLSIKLFGAELAFLSHKGGKDKLTSDGLIDRLLEMLLDSVDRAKDFEYHFKNHLHFLDAELVYPTGLGLPLTLGVTGTSAVHLKTSGKIDLFGIIKNPRSSAVQFALEPSASIRIAGSLIIEGYGVESGVKAIATLHTATGIDLTVKLLEQNGIDINIGVPKQKQELINVVSEILVSSGPKGDNYVDIEFPKGKEHSDCFDQLSSIVGLTVCGKVSYPSLTSTVAGQKKPHFPLSGPAALSVYLETNDVRNYHFKAYCNTKTSTPRCEILLETPNSRTDRRISLVAEAAYEPERFARVVFDSPWKKASIEGIIKNNDREKTLTFTVRHDTIEYFIRTGLVGTGSQYRPVLEYKVPDHIEKLAGVKGGVKSNSQRSGQQYTVEGVIDVNNNYNGGKRYVLDKVSVSSGGQALISVDGSIAIIPGSNKADLKIEYGGDTYALIGEIEGTTWRNQKTLISVVPSKNKEHGFSVSYENKGNVDSAGEQTLIIVHGSDLNSQTKRITYVGKHDIKYVSPVEFELSLSRKLTYPALGLVAHVEGGINPKYIGYDLEFKYAKFNLESELSAKTGTTKPGDFDIEFEAALQSNSIQFKTNRVIIDDHKNKFTTSLELHPGGKYELQATIENNAKPGSINTHLDSEIKINGKKILIDLGLEANENKVNSQAVVNYENSKYLDFELALQRGINPNGNLKLNLKNYLTASGKFRYQKGSAGDAQIEINIPKFNRKITGHGEISITGSKHIANVEILYDAAKDPKKRFKLTSDSDLTSNSIDTKNTIEILDYKTVINAKGTIQGERENGRSSGEIEVTLPNGRYIVGKGSRSVTTRDELMDGQMQFELIDHVTKGGQSRKIIYTPEVHNLNVKEMTFQAKHDLRLVNFNGDNIEVVLALKNVANGPDKKSAEIQLDVSGSKLPSPFSFQFALDRENDGALASGKLRSSLGNNLNIQATGNFVRGNNVDKPTTQETVIDIKLPSEKLKSIKLELSNSILTPNVLGGRFEYIEKSQLTYNGDKTIKLDSHFTNSGIPDESHSVEGTGKVTVGVLSNAPVTVGYSYKHNPVNELKETSASVTVNCPNGVTTIGLDSTYTKKMDVLNLNLKATTPIEKFRNVEINLKHKETFPGDIGRIPTSGKTDLALIVDQVKYTISNEFEVNPDKLDVHVIIVAPEGTTEQIIKINKLGDKEYSGEYKYNSPKGFVNIDGTVKVPSIDDFNIVINLDSDKLKTRKLHTEITNKVAKSGKRILISITSDGKNIISGSTNYKKHTEGGKTIVEGNGSLKINENTKSSSFKYTQQQLSGDVDGETGPAILLNINFGQSSIVGEVKATNKEFHLLNSYCEQSADCAQINIQTKIINAELKHARESTIEVDLRKFNVPYEFGLKSNQVIDPQSGFDSSATLYLHSSKEKTQYSYQVYGRLTESGIVITLPSRELALIGTFEVPKNKRSGPYKIDISSYLDRKARPKEKTSLTISGDVVIDKTSGSLSGETRFSYPSHPKDLTVKGKVHFGGAHLLDGNLDIDIFETRNQKILVVAKLLKAPINQGYNITGTLSVTSAGQRLNVGLDQHLTFSQSQIGFGSILSYNDKQRKPKSTGIQFSANLQEAHLLITAPDQQLIKADTRIDLTKNLQKIHTDLSIFGRDPVVISFEIKDLNSFKYLYQATNNPNKFEATGRFLLGQLAEIQADYYKDGSKKELFHALLHFDEKNYLKPDFAVSNENIALLIEAYRTRIAELVKVGNEFIKEVSQEIVTELKDLIDHLKKARPNLKPLLDHYVNQLNKLKDELNIETQGIKEIQEKLNKIFGGPIAAIVEAVKKLYAQYEDLQKTYLDLVDRIQAALKATLPELQKSGRAIAAIIVAIVDDANSALSTNIKTLVNIFNAHKDEIRQIAIIASQLIKDVSAIVLKAVTNIQTEVKDFFTVLIAELKALPIYGAAQQKYKEVLNYDITSTVVRVLDDIAIPIERFMPTKAFRDLVASFHDYIIAHVKQEKVDDVKELKKLWAHTLQAIQSLIDLISNRANTNNFAEVLRNQIPFEFGVFSKLPGITTLKISVLSLLRNRELPSLADLLYAYRPRLNPSNLVPPFGKFAVFLDGGHFFTFDGRHLTYPGKCSYVLAQDARDGNFSIVAELDDGKLTSVTLTEPAHTITFQSTGAILVDNQPADFPASTQNLNAYINGPIVKISSEYGVQLLCNKKAPLICGVHVSGFYHGKLRGILGTANNEPSDDFTVPSGQVTESVSDFGNAYKLNGRCPAVQSAHHHATPQSAQCTEFFTGRSPMSGCFNTINPSPYREACEHAASAGAQKEGACLIAAAYYSACREADIFIDIPTSCGSCEVGNQKIAIGDSFSVQHPKQQADIIFVLEQATENERVFHELIVPLIPIIKNELRDHGITDVHIGLIGFGDNIARPQHYTLQGSLNIDGDVKNIQFTARTPTITYAEAKSGDLKQKLEFLDQKIDVELGTFKLTDAYEEALDYEFRPAAAKTIVGVIATPCEKSPLPISLQQLRLILGHKAYSDLGLTYHQIATLDDILISGKAVKNVVGFDSESVFTFADSKKKPMEGSTELKNNLVVSSGDVCASFAANSGGAAFSAHNFLEAKPNQKRQFLQVAGRRLVSSLVNTEIKEDCVCKQKFGVYPRPECKIVSRKEKEPVGRPTKGGVKG